MSVVPITQDGLPGDCMPDQPPAASLLRSWLAVGSVAVGAFASTRAARSAGQIAVGGVGSSFRFLGRNTVRAVRRIGPLLESGYTRVRGREKYLEHEIQQLREQITRLEQKID